MYVYNIYYILYIYIILYYIIHGYHNWLWVTPGVRPSEKRNQLVRYQGSEVTTSSTKFRDESRSDGNRHPPPKKQII